jgi:hypothetical protein
MVVVSFTTTEAVLVVSISAVPHTYLLTDEIEPG